MRYPHFNIWCVQLSSPHFLFFCTDPSWKCYDIHKYTTQHLTHFIWFWFGKPCITHQPYAHNFPEHIRRFYRIYFKQETLVNSMLRINRYNLQIRIAVHPCLPFCYFISSHLYEQHEWLQPARISWLNHFLLLQHFWQDCNAQPQRWTSSPPAPGTWSESSAASSPPARWFGLGAQRCPIPSRSNIVGKCRGNYVWFYRQRLRFDVTRGSSRHARMCPA